jgi:hypothetical protein
MSTQHTVWGTRASRGVSVGEDGSRKAKADPWAKEFRASAIEAMQLLSCAAQLLSQRGLLSIEKELVLKSSTFSVAIVFMASADIALRGSAYLDNPREEFGVSLMLPE